MSIRKCLTCLAEEPNDVERDELVLHSEHTDVFHLWLKTDQTVLLYEFFIKGKEDGKW